MQLWDTGEDVDKDARQFVAHEMGRITEQTMQNWPFGTLQVNWNGERTKHMNITPRQFFWIKSILTGRK